MTVPAPRRSRGGGCARCGADVEELMDADRKALDVLFSATYEELRRLAHQVRRGDPSATLNPTALVNEAYLKLVDSLDASSVSREHFKRIAARAMRQVLVDAARRRNAGKRGGGAAVVTLDEELAPHVETADQLLALDGALGELERLSPRQALLVEYRFFGGLALSEVAEALSVSESTVDRDWRAARAWLATRLTAPA